MIIFEVIWNTIGILYAILGLLLCSLMVFLAMALIAGIADKGVNKKGKQDDKDAK